jgi:virulence factor Mce-like protein
LRRVVGILVTLVAAGCLWVVLGASSNGAKANQYWVELDNAFGIVNGGDLKIAGVRAGKITTLKLDKKTNRALVGIQIDKTGFGDLRSDTHCDVRPQSLIGEYFLDCQPGNSQTELKPGSTIPVKQTFSTIPPDLVGNVLRLPQRERLRIILNELGTGLAARGQDLNLTVRRGVPALRETDKLLAILARQNQVLADLTKNADEVITALANNHHNVGRWVQEARDTSAASAERQADIAATWAKLPGFLEQLTPTMKELGRAVDAQTPALQDLNASAGQLERFFNNLGPFSEASRPYFRSLGEASIPGRQAVTAAKPTVAELRKATPHLPELGKNLAIVLEDLYDRNRASEKDARAPGENTGWNGFEALLGYVFWQSQAINIFDRNGYILKVALFDNRCTNYQDAASVKADPSLKTDCYSQLGPTQPGVNAPDTSLAPGQSRAASNDRTRVLDDARVINGAEQAAGPPPAPESAPAVPPKKTDTVKPPIDLQKTIDKVLDGLNLPPLPNLPNLPTLPNGKPDPTNAQTASQLLDYLLGQ